jgi:parallel beta-helix repeat protein
MHRNIKIRYILLFVILCIISANATAANLTNVSGNVSDSLNISTGDPGQNYTHPGTNISYFENNSSLSVQNGSPFSNQVEMFSGTGTIFLNDSNLQGTTGSKYWVINQPGNYFVNLAGGKLTTSNQYAILIRASDVFLDGNNLVIHNSGSVTGKYGLWAQNGLLHNITVSNFCIDNYDYAVEYQDISSGVINNITVTGNNVGIWAYNSSYLVIENCHAHGRNNYAIFLNIHCTNNHVRNNQIHDNVEGLYVIQSDNNFVYNNDASNNDLTGIYFGYESQADSNIIYNNTARYNDYGILLDRYCDNNSVFSNTAQYNRKAGIMLVMDEKNKVFSNTVTDNYDVGMFLHTDNHNNEIYGNEISRNKYGTIVAVNNYLNNVSENTISNNAEKGLWVSENSTYNTLNSNTVQNNGYGIFVYASSRNIFENNSVSKNILGGIYLDRTTGNNEFRKNQVVNNTGSGMYLFASSNEKIVNNYFSNVKNIGLASTNANNAWNYPKTIGRNIINGPYLGGNFYGSPDNTGFSQVTPDTDRDGICDTAYTFKTDDISSTINTDYFPLHVYQNPSTIGLFRNGFWILDKNGNFQWDGTSGNNPDIVAGFGQSGDTPVIGNWNHVIPGDKIGVFRNGSWLIDYNGNYQWDSADKSSSLGQTGDVPVTGDWSNNGDKKIGVFRNGFWMLDKNGNYQWDGPGAGDVVAGFGQPGDIPVTGDWNGNHQEKIGVFRNGFWILDKNGNFQWDGTGTGSDLVAGFGMAGDTPVVKDWNGDNQPEIAVFRPSSGLWIIDYNRNYLWDGTGTGQDVTMYLGQSGDVAIAGDWNSNINDKIGIFRGGFWIIDYNGNNLWEGPPNDKVAGFGMAGDIPVTGKY